MRAQRFAAAASGTPQFRRVSLWRRVWKNRDMYVMLPLALLIAFRYLPMYGIQIAFREGLKWIRHLYEEGLITEETFIQDNSHQVAGLLVQR